MNANRRSTCDAWVKLKPGRKAAVIHAPEDCLDELSHDAGLSAALNGKFDWVQLFVRNKAELDALAPKAARALHPESILWISFPKGSSGIQIDLRCDQGWESVQQRGLKWVNLVSINETWSASGMRPYRDYEERQSFR